MLILGRFHGQCIEVTHRSGDVLRIYVRVDPEHPDYPEGYAELVFDDAPRNFEILRAEHRRRPPRRREKNGGRPIAAEAACDG